MYWGENVVKDHIVWGENVVKDNNGKKVKNHNLVSISTTITKEMRDLIKANHMSYNELIVVGFNARNGFQQLLNRVSTLEEGNKKLQSKLTTISTQLLEH